VRPKRAVSGRVAGQIDAEKARLTGYARRERVAPEAAVAAANAAGGTMDGSDMPTIDALVIRWLRHWNRFTRKSGKKVIDGGRCPRLLPRAAGGSEDRSGLPDRLVAMSLQRGVLNRVIR